MATQDRVLSLTFNAKDNASATIKKITQEMEAQQAKIAGLNKTLDAQSKAAIEKLSPEKKARAEALQALKAEKEALKENEKALDAVYKKRADNQAALAFYGAALATVAVATGALVKSTIDQADAMDEMAQRTGLTTEKLSGLQDYAKRSATDIDTLAKGMQKLKIAAVKSPEIFEKLGISVKDANGKIKEGDVLYGEFGDALNQLGDSAEADAIGTDALSKSYLDLKLSLQGGSAAMEDSKQKAEDLGAVLGTDFGKAAGKFNDSIDDIALGIKGQLIGEVSKVLPALQLAADGVVGFQKNIVAAQNEAKQIAKDSNLSGFQKYTQGIWLGVKAYTGFYEKAKEVKTITKELADEQVKAKDLITPSIDEGSKAYDRQKKIVVDLKKGVEEAMERIAKVSKDALDEQKKVGEEFKKITDKIAAASGSGKLSRELDAIQRSSDAKKAKDALASDEAKTKAEEEGKARVDALQKGLDAAKAAYDTNQSLSNASAVSDKEKALAREVAEQAENARLEEKKAKLKAIDEIEKGKQVSDEQRLKTRLALERELSDIQDNVKQNGKNKKDSTAEIERLRALAGQVEQGQKAGDGVFTQDAATALARQIQDTAAIASKQAVDIAKEETAQRLANLKKEVTDLKVSFNKESIDKSVKELIASIDEGLKIKEFGITIRPAAGGTQPPGFANGGYLSGPGTGKSDSFLIRASNGEFMQPVEAVSYYGANVMEQLRRREIDPRVFSNIRGYANGGTVTNSNATTSNFAIDLRTNNGNISLNSSMSQADLALQTMMYRLKNK